MKNGKRLNVTVTEYEGDVEFPEASSYPEFVAAELSERFGAVVEVGTGLASEVHSYGFGADESEIEEQALAAIKVDLWEEFCAEGYKQFSVTL